MSLGADKTVCLNELKTALRVVAGDAVDNPPAEANLEALAQAIYAILATDAAVSIDATTNATFWAWLQTVGTFCSAGPPPTALTGKLT
ncbi:MAG TPA: hypothetical protein VHP82_12355 [Gaiellaceae bacterium]|jgi:hypothetical protein|nr:hypothetical protein [Gaiellaceae bacterium]